MKLRGFYAIVDVTTDAGALSLQEGGGRTWLQEAERLLAAQPCMLQLRAKGASARDLSLLARALLPLARSANVPLCVNDRLDVALAVGADAVHLGQDDLPLTEARRLAGDQLTIGISTHNLMQVHEAVGGGADYIGFGPVFPTGTKKNPDPLVGLMLLRDAVAVVAARIPIVAIGGIDLGQVEAVAATGASAAAVIGAVRRSADVTAAGRSIDSAFRRPFVP